MNWNDIEDIAIELAEKYPDTDPLSVRFTDLRQSIIEVFRTSPEKE
jgi:FeS assembly protein IscX